MNKTTIIGIVLGVIVIGGAIWYGVSHKGAAAEPTAQGEQTTVQPTSGSGSIADLWGMAGSMKCDVQSTDSANPFNGTVYVSGGKMHVDATAQANGKTVNMHMVRADGFLYTWSDMMPQGIKIPESAAQSGKPASAPTQSQGVSGTTKVSYTCAPWVPDATLLAPPASVTFMDIPTAGSASAGAGASAGAAAAAAAARARAGY